MKLHLIFLLLTTNFYLLQGQEISENNDPKKHPTLVNKTFVEQINGKPIEYYLKNKDILPTAKMFYNGEYAIYDDGGTFSFLDSILTTNSITRPFYFFIYNQVMKITDGAVAEYMAGTCREYLEKFPCEFLVYSQDKQYQVDINKWIGFVGFDVYDLPSFKNFAADLDKKIKMNCSSRKQDWESLKIRIKEKLEKK